MNDREVTEIWQLYQKGVEHHTSSKLYSDSETAFDFYEGNQWKNVKVADNVPLAILNFIKPIVDHKVNSISDRQMSIIYSSMASGLPPEIVDYLNKGVARWWEKEKLDTKVRQAVLYSAVTGNHYFYFMDDRRTEVDEGGVPLQAMPDTRPKIKISHAYTTNVYLSNEQQKDINKQEWIIISERVPVADVRKLAEENGVDPSLITGDEDTQYEIGENKDKEVKTELGKCTTLLFMRKTAEGIEYCRSTKTVKYVPETTLEDLKIYPLVAMSWNDRINNARGLSDVKYLIQDQKIINVIASQRAANVHLMAYPKTVYDSTAITNISALKSAGASIAVQGLATGQRKIADVIQYLTAPQASPDAAILQNEIMNTARELSGAGDAALGNINPEQASGTAIKAAIDQASIPLNEPIANLTQFIEDIAIVWFNLMVAVSLNTGMMFDDEGGGTAIIPAEMLANMEVDIKIDVSPVDPYSVAAQEMQVMKLLEAGYITFEQTLELLPERSSIPVSRLKEVVGQALPQEVVEFLKQNPQMIETIIQIMQPQGMPQGTPEQIPPGIGMPMPQQPSVPEIHIGGMM